MKSRAGVIALGLLAVTGLALTGCGLTSSGGSDTTTQASTATQSATTAGGNGLTVQMGDYSFTPQTLTAKAGKVDITAPNGGQVQHELVLLKTDQSPTSLPLKGEDVDEDAAEAHGAENVGEITDVGPGQSQTKAFNLTPGKYVIICNLPGHFSRGMYGTLTVK